LLLGLAAALVLLWAPAPGVAATPDLARGAGYASPEGSQPVREVQRLLRRLGQAPGPVDGLYGPMTEAAVMRFQEAHSLLVDGVVGPQTRGQLATERTRLRKAARKSPDPVNRAESVRSHPPPSLPPQPAHPQPHAAQLEDATDPAAPILGGVAGLAVLLLGIGLWRLAGRRRQRVRRPDRATPTGPRLGLVCAALLAAFAVGAASGAVFATHASPDDHPETSAR
jgi:hypothetical protein